MDGELLAGAAEIGITPPAGLDMAGGVFPRTNTGVRDPLMIKALALESGGQKIVYAIADVISFSAETGDAAVREAAARTGIDADSIVWAATHTHSGPYTVPLFAHDGVNREWLASVPGKFAACVALACGEMRPVRLKRVRGFARGIAHNRRVRFKDGWTLNTWLLREGVKDVQALGAAGCIDPEVITLSFEETDGSVMAVLFQTVLHANTRFGTDYSGDYPAVVTTRIRERYGKDAVCLYVPGACADLNASQGFDCDTIGDAYADIILKALAKKNGYEEDVSIKAVKGRITVPLRDPAIDFEERLQKSNWPDSTVKAFRKSIELARESGRTEKETVVQAWRIGNIGFASLPGEVFVETGLRLKRESPFPWTVPVELGGDSLAYLITDTVWKEGGYEPLIGSIHPTTSDGTGKLTQEALRLLNLLQ